MDAVFQHGPEPFNLLLAAACGELSGSGRALAMKLDLFPKLGNAIAGERGIGHDRRRPVLRTRREDMQCGAVFARCGAGAFEVITIGLVDRDHVGEFDEALFDALQLIACTWKHQREKEISHVGHGGFRLSDTDVSTRITS